MAVSRIFQVCLFVLLGAMPAARAENAVHTLPEGGYISRDYLQTLRSTRSPLAAISVPRSFVFAVVRHRGGQTIIDLKWLSPELLGSLIFDEFGRVQKDNFSRGFQELEIGDRDSFQLVYSHGGKGTDEGVARVARQERTRFEFFPRIDIPQLLNRESIAGTYVDREGAKYEYTPDGLARFPGTTFRYGVASTPVDSQFDYYVVLDEKSQVKQELGDAAYTSFEWRQGKLLLFRISADEHSGIPIRRDHSPYLVLEPK